VYTPDAAELETQAVPAQRPDVSALETQEVRAQRPGALGLAGGWTGRAPTPGTLLPGISQAQARTLRTWGMRMALVAVLIVLGLRANLNSLAFVSPGGAIIGWTNPPKPDNPFANLPTPSTTKVWTPESYAAYLTEHMTLDVKLGEMIMIQFGGNLTPAVETALATNHVGGVLLLGRPVAPSDRDLNAQMQQLGGNQLLVSIDQEGGSVNRFFAVAGSAPSASSLTTPAAARAEGEHDAQLLHQYGYNFNLAPVVDLGAPNEDSQFFGRTFSSDPQQVALLAGAFLDGLQSEGTVTAVLKHFPGGVESTGVDPHRFMPVLRESRAQWEQLDLAPYQAMLAANDVRAIMVSHEMIPAVDPKYPTSLSPTIITDVLRTELGFNGVVISDDLHMKALEASWTIPEASVQAIKAGTDIVADLAVDYGLNEVQPTVAAIKQSMSKGEITQARIDASVQRILTLKIRMGLIPLPAQARPHPRRQIPPGPDGPVSALYPERTRDAGAAA
jgi:beta-N-acetylhexosaminidase